MAAGIEIADSDIQPCLDAYCGPADYQGSDGPEWQQMINRADKYLPLIERCVGYHLMMGYLDDDDAFDLSSDYMLEYIPVLRLLSDHELEFVSSEAMTIICEHHPGSTIKDMASDWMADGAPV